MAITKYVSYYNQIREKIVQIKDHFGYAQESVAFAHWFLQTYMHLSEQEIGESIIDGSDDNGIDAIIFNEDQEELIVLQFKFPQNSSLINKGITQADILKTIRGFKLLLGVNTRSKVKGNQQFVDFKKMLNTKPIFHYKLYFVSFGKGVIDNQATIDEFKDEFIATNGGDMQIEDINKIVLANFYEKLNRKNTVEITLKYKLIQAAYNIESSNVNSFIGVVNAIDLIRAIKDQLLVIFDENIRLFEEKSLVNDNIKNTASSDESNMFYFYNNGIVLICDSAENSPISLSVRLKGASIVNGCQTVSVLANLSKVNLLKSDVDLLMRIIVIDGYDQRAKITEYLNTQTPIKDSYFISNHPIIRELQKLLKEKGYFLERQINEKQHKKKYGEEISEDLVVLQLENVIQYYTGYSNDNYAYIAKRGKKALFDKDKIDEILSEINCEKVIESYETYQKVAKVITLYRKNRRNPENDEFPNYIGLSPEEYISQVNEFIFVNTSDILLLNTTKILKEKYSLKDITKDTEELIKEAIFICKDSVSDCLKKETNSSLANITKNSPVFVLAAQKAKR